MTPPIQPARAVLNPARKGPHASVGVSFDSRRARLMSRGGMRRAQSGFSLIEIIIVTVLIGGIVAFAASQILGGSDRAKANLAKAQIQTVAQKVQSYETDTGELPGSLDDLVAAPGNAQGWMGPYAKAAELKDPWKHALEYRTPGENGPFDLVSYGADGKPGGTSVAADIAYE